MRNPDTEWMDDPLGPQVDAAGVVASAPDLGHMLDVLPFGMQIAGPAGEVAYANESFAWLSAAVAGQGVDGVLKTRSFDFTLGGKPYTVSLLVDETEQMTREQALIRRAYFDELTGLPNRRVIEQSVNALIGPGAAPFALAFIDVDGFKHVNDFYGHNVGDALLIQIAERVASGLRESDMLARLSGDEFLLLLSPIADLDRLGHDIDVISDRLKEPFYIEGNEILTSASIGVSVFPDDGASYDALTANADRAMYRGKAVGTGSVQFFDATIEHAAIEKSRLEQRLRLAIRDRRVSCAYQPKMDILTGNVCGVEVLLRWIDEDGVIQPPGDFIALAIDLGLMDDLTYLVLDKTVRSIDRLNEAFGETASISLNVAAKQAGDIKFMRELLARIAATEFATRFILEITEEAFVSKSTFQESVLPLIREIGARVSIDDFGVGYSSLSALADITADEVKIDRSFITNLHQRPRSQNILKAVEALSRSLGMDVIVEGLETFEELAYLKACTSIRYVQGYYFSRPVMLEELEDRRDESLRQETVIRPMAMNRAFGGRGR
ncbi:bifunctional diguanylate cyclase/phosphodiesterase [Rhizobium sp. TH2]|uniref:putative bifunctional diguanylate cyclase/phosphodiesterase n=1 Tax=Rhizobium sp. TH2 TaxID=2775403 RepID=UPI0021585537|nr:EAL domain-containing protein [Rhizobium sp. TH2]